MALFDMLALGVIALSAVISAMRGVIHEVASLFTWIVAFVAAKMFARPFAEAALTAIEPPALATVAGFVLVFAAAWVAQGLLRSALSAGVSAVGLGGVNRLFGAAFGVLKGVLLVTLAVLVCAFTDLPQSEDWKNAVSAPYFEGLAGFAVPYLPDYLAEQVRYPAF